MKKTGLNHMFAPLKIKGLRECFFVSFLSGSLSLSLSLSKTHTHKHAIKIIRKACYVKQARLLSLTMTVSRIQVKRIDMSRAT